MSQPEFKTLEAFFKDTDEARFDLRLAEKKVEHGFMTRAEREGFLKSLPAESEFDFTSAEKLDAQDS